MSRLDPLEQQFRSASGRLLQRLTGPTFNSGNGFEVACPPMSEDEYLWEPVAGAWTVRRRNTEPAPRATFLSGAGDWGRDAAEFPHPEPPPFTTLAWRLSHLTELLALRAEYAGGPGISTRETFLISGGAATAIEALKAAVAAWADVLATIDDADLDVVGYSQYPYGSDPDTPFVDIVGWVNEEVLAHGAEIALLRDLYRERH